MTEICPACYQRFDSKKAFDDHVETDTHVRGVQKLMTGNKYRISNELEREEEEEEEDVYRCDVCNIRCYGIFNYTAHINGRPHRKQLVKRETVRRLDDYTRCEPCGISCTGPENYAEHVRGESHAREVKKYTLMSNLATKYSTDIMKWMKEVDSQLREMRETIDTMKEMILYGFQKMSDETKLMQDMKLK